MDVPILFEDADVLVLDKPAGLSVHSDGRTQEPTLVDWLLEHYPEIRDVGESPLESKTSTLKPIMRPGIVHRLDRDTSGVMVVAKTEDAYLFLKKNFKDRTVEKSYLALAYDNLKNDEGVIDRPIGKSGKDFRRRSATSDARGVLREAVTYYQVKERFLLREKLESDFVLLALFPKTGRTHQIRVHLKAISHPVVCDKLYAPSRECPVFSLSRQALHAERLTFFLPNGLQKSFEAPLPEDFQRALEALRKLC